MSQEEQTNNETGAEDLLLLNEISQLKSREVRIFVAHLQAAGARAFIRFPDGKELPIPCVQPTITGRRAI